MVPRWAAGSKSGPLLHSRVVSIAKFMALLDDAQRFEQLELHDEARKAYEDPRLRSLQATLGPKERYSYAFHYANVLGRLGELRAMDQWLTRALTVAAEELQDLERCKHVWYWLLHWCRERGDWAFLEAQCQAAQRFGVEAGSASIQQMAAEFSAHADLGLGRRERARYGAERILARLEAIGADPERLAEWQAFLESLGPAA